MASDENPLSAIQVEYESFITQNPFATYAEAVVPYTKRVAEWLSTSKTFPVMKIINRGIDVYSETLMTLFTIDYLNGKTLPLSINAVVTMLIKHPFLINLVFCWKTYAEIRKYKAELLQELETSYKSSEQTDEYEKLHALLSPRDSITSTSLDYYHYFAGFTFKPDMVSIKRETLPKGPDVCYYIIHLSHGLKDTRAIVIYKNIPRWRRKLLTPDAMRILETMSFPDMKSNPKRDELVDINFKEITTPKSKIYVLLCYDDGASTPACTFSIASLTNPYITESEYTILSKGGCLPCITKQVLELYVITNFKTEVRQKDVVVDVALLDGKLSNIITSVVSLPVISDIIEGVMQHPDLSTICDPKRAIALRTYLLGLHSVGDNIVARKDYIRGFFYREELD